MFPTSRLPNRNSREIAQSQRLPSKSSNEVEGPLQLLPIFWVGWVAEPLEVVGQWLKKFVLESTRSKLLHRPLLGLALTVFFMPLPTQSVNQFEQVSQFTPATIGRVSSSRADGETYEPQWKGGL